MSKIDIDADKDQFSTKVNFYLKLYILEKLNFYFPNYTIHNDVTNKIFKSSRKYPWSCSYSTMYFAKTLLDTPRDERFGWINPPEFELHALHNEIKEVIYKVMDDNREYSEVCNEIRTPKKIYVTR